MDIRLTGSGLFALVTMLAGPVVAQLRQAQQTAEIGHVTVYVRNRDVPSQVQNLAEVVADKIFAGVGLSIDWRCERPATRRLEGSIAIDLAVAPQRSRPHPVAFALPYEGVHIRVFYDRIQEERNPAAMLAHVLVHEITHILQGMVRHSETGIMKARWSAADIDEMGYKALPFTPLDVMLIQRGVAHRTAAAATPATENSGDEIADSH